MSVELRDVLQINDFTVHLRVSYSLGNQLTRAEIELVLAENNLPTPDRDVSFIIEDSKPRYFKVTYLIDADEYVYQKQNIAG